MTVRDDRMVDKKRGEVHLYSREGQLPQRVSDCVRGDVRLVTHHFHGQHVPTQVDYYIVASLGSAVEKEASRLHALPVVLPAAADWLASKIDAATKARQNVILMMRRMP